MRGAKKRRGETRYRSYTNERGIVDATWRGRAVGFFQIERGDIILPASQPCSIDHTNILTIPHWLFEYGKDGLLFFCCFPLPVPLLHVSSCTEYFFQEQKTCPPLFLYPLLSTGMEEVRRSLPCVLLLNVSLIHLRRRAFN